jgi:hypothetical protein
MRETRVTGDWLACEFAPGCEFCRSRGLDGHYLKDYPALVPEPGEANPPHWNGWAIPTFDRETTLAIVADQSEELVAQFPETDRLIAVEEPDGTLVVFHLVGDAYYDSVPPEERVDAIYRPDESGRYAIGAYSWTWVELAPEVQAS